MGNATQGLSLNTNEIILVMGENLDMGGDDAGARNGCGKSALMNALSYALYGWAISDIKKENLINKTNGKNMVVTLDFESAGNSYRIVRGRKPNILEFYKDGVKQSDTDTEDSAQGDSRETQQEIERILGMSQDMFCQIVAINTYTVPFLFQTANEQRTIIEQLLGITLLSEKAEHLKDEMKLVKEQITLEGARIAGAEEASKRIQAQIDTLRSRQATWTLRQASDIETLRQKIDEMDKIDIERELAIHADWQVYESAKRDLLNIQQKQQHLTSLKQKEERLLATLNNDLDSLKNKCCHTCKQTINTDVHRVLMAEIEGKIEQSKADLNKLLDDMAGLHTEMENIKSVTQPSSRIYSSLNDAHNHRNKVMLLHQQYEQKLHEIDPYQDQIDAMQNSALQEIDLTSMNALTKFSEHQEFLLKLLTNKDSFIRKKIIEQNLSYLNSRLHYYLNALCLPHEVIFENDLTVSISEFGRDLSPGNLSRGEMERLSLGLSFAFRDVWENLYQKINLIFCDEKLDNGLDSNGVNNAVKLLRAMNREQGRDVWIISHREEIVNKVNIVCRAVKENGFTSFNMET